MASGPSTAYPEPAPSQGGPGPHPYYGGGAGPGPYGPGPAGPSPSYPMPRYGRRRKEKIGIPLFMAGFVVAGVGILLVGLGVGGVFNTLLNPYSLSGGRAAAQVENGYINETFYGIDLVGVGVMIIGVGAGINAAARFDQNQELGQGAH